MVFNMKNIDIGLRIKYLRKQAGLSQEKLARKIAFDRTIISKIESGKYNVTVNTLEQICDGIGVTLKDFFDFEY